MLEELEELTMEEKVLPVAKRIKKEPEDVTTTYVEYDSYGFDSYSDLNGEELLSIPLDTLKTPVSKHTSSPAQEATRARIGTFEVQLKRLYRLRLAGKLDTKGALQIRCLEEDLRKAHSKLRRLLNEAERQRRRRERLRSRGNASASPSKMMMLMTVRGKRDGYHSYGELATTAASYGSQSEDAMLVTSRAQDDLGVMAALRNCAKFEDFVREINSLGFALTRLDEDQHQVYDLSEDAENGNDGEVKVQVELIEGDGVLDQNMSVVESEVQEVKTEPPSPPISPSPITIPDQEEKSRESDAHSDSKNSKKRRPPEAIKSFVDEYARKQTRYMREWQEQYQEWFERQLESQQQWEETFMREQMELAKSMLENVTSTFLQGMQQVLQNVVASIGRRSLTPFIPSFSRNLDMNGLNHNDMPIFLSPELSTNGPTVVSTRSLAEKK